MFTTEISHTLTVHENGAIDVLRRRKVFEDGELVAEKLHRRVLEPGADLAAEPPRLAAIANAVWTPKVISDFELARAAALAAALAKALP